MISTEDRLNEIAQKHGLRVLRGDMNVAEYTGHSLAIMMVELGWMGADEVESPVPVFAHGKDDFK